MNRTGTVSKGRFVIYTLWTVLASLVGFFVGRIFRYAQRLLRQPYLVYDLAISEAVSADEIAAMGLLIASENLRDGIEKRPLANGEEKWVLCAGRRNFREPWARDFSFASFGLMALDELQVVKEGLEVFLAYQRPSGQFPVKIHSTGVLDRYFHSLFKREQPIHVPLRPKYITAHRTISLDGNGLLIIAALHYARRSGDYAFVQTHWQALKNALVWMETHATLENGLLRQGAYTDWADSIARTGRVIYTNVIYWKALHELACAAAHQGTPTEQEYFEAKAEKVKNAINEHFWREDLGYFITSRRFKILSSGGNLLAIAWQLATPEQGHRILDSMATFGMATPVPTRVTHRHYPIHYIAPENWLAGIAHYHTSVAWLWLGGWHVIALARLGRLAEAKELLQRIDQVIVRDGIVHEAYGVDGEHLSTRWYTSEAPLTWNAGMVVYAHYVLEQAVATPASKVLSEATP